jgi:lipopolysaccharide export system permease protein
MKTIDRYIGMVLLQHFGFALAALLAIFSVLTLTEELRSSATHLVGVSHAVTLALLTVPAQAYALFPASALLGTVMGLGQMARHHELVALHAAGISRARLAASVLALAVVIAVVGTVLGEMIAAPLSQLAHKRRALASSGGRTLSPAAGMWVRDGARFVNIGHVHPDGSLGDIFIYDFENVHTLRRFARARTATRHDGQWTLADVEESVFTSGGATTRHVATEAWDALIDPGRLKALWLQPEDISATDLHRTIGWLRLRGQSPLRYELAFWRRVSAPLYTVLMVMLALPVVLMAGARARIGEHIVVGAVLGMGFQMLQQTFSNFGLVAGLHPLLTALAPAGVALLAMTLLFRAVGTR